MPHPKLRPVDLANEGEYRAGLAHSPRFIDETIAHAKAVAGRAATILSRAKLDIAGQVAKVDPEGCVACATTGKIEREHILGAFEKGIDGVLIAGCLEGGCHFIEGNLRAKRRSEQLRDILDEIGVGRERLRMVNLSAAMAPTFVQRVNEIVQTIEGLGPNPLKALDAPETAQAQKVGVP